MRLPLLRLCVLRTKVPLLSVLGSRNCGMETEKKLHVNVDVTSDVVCPWCWIGKRHIDAAMQKLAENFVFHVRWKPFLLNPRMSEEGVPLEEYMRHKFGEAAVASLYSGESPVTKGGKAVGIKFNPNRLVVPTKKAHLLLSHAAKQGQQHNLQEVLFRAYFTDGLNITDERALRQLLAEVGMEEESAIASLSDPEAVRGYEEEVKEANRKAFDCYVLRKVTKRGLCIHNSFLSLSNME